MASLSPDELRERMAAFQQKVKASPMWDAGQEMLIPGENAHRLALARQARGIPLPVQLYDELLALAQELHVSQPLPPVAA